MYTPFSYGFRWLGAIAGMFAVAALACHERQSQEDAEKITPERSVRIVSLSPGLSRLIVGFGLAPQIVGADSESRELPELANSVDLGDPSRVEAGSIAALEPSLVLALAERHQAAVVSELQERGIPGRAFAPTNANDIIQAIDELGVVLNRQTYARFAVRELTREISKIATERDGKRRLQVIWILERDPFTIVGDRGLLHEMLELAGGEMALHRLPGERVEVSLEEITAGHADLILDSSPMRPREPIGIEARIEALPPSISEMPTLDLLERIRFLHARFYPSQ